MKKTILIFNGYYIPAKNYGGPTTSVQNIVENCGDHFEFRIVAANHDFGDNKIFDNILQGWNQVGKAKVRYIDEKQYSYSSKRIQAIIEETQAALVCLAGIFRPEIKWCAINVCRKYNIPVLLSPRGEVCDQTFAMKRYKKAPYAKLVTIIGLFKNVVFHATSEEEKQGLIKYFKVPEENIYTVPNISKQFINRNKGDKVSGRINIIFISRIQFKKNITFAIDVVNRLKCETVFDIYGPIESKAYWENCKQLIRKSPSNVQINYYGELSPDEVGPKFGEYDCFLFPTLSENYGHVIAEAMLNCCPVVLSKGTTPWDDLDSKAGYVVDLSNSDGFVASLERIAAMDNIDYSVLIRSSREYITSKIGKNNAVQGHIDMFNSVLKPYS